MERRSFTREAQRQSDPLEVRAAGLEALFVQFPRVTPNHGLNGYGIPVREKSLGKGGLLRSTT